MLRMHYFSLETIIRGRILKTPQKACRHPAPRLPGRSDMSNTAGEHTEGKEGSQDLFLPVETRDAEL